MFNKLFRLITVILVFSGSLFAEEDDVLPIHAEVHDDAIPCLVNFSSMPSTIVNVALMCEKGLACIVKRAWPALGITQCGRRKNHSNYTTF